MKITDCPTFNKNWQKLPAVAEVVLKTLKGLDLQWPPLSTERFKK